MQLCQLHHKVCRIVIKDRTPNIEAGAALGQLQKSLEISVGIDIQRDIELVQRGAAACDKMKVRTIDSPSPSGHP